MVVLHVPDPRIPSTLTSFVANRRSPIHPFAVPTFLIRALAAGTFASGLNHFRRAVAGLTFVASIYQHTLEQFSRVGRGAGERFGQRIAVIEILLEARHPHDHSTLGQRSKSYPAVPRVGFARIAFANAAHRRVMQAVHPVPHRLRY